MLFAESRLWRGAAGLMAALILAAVLVPPSMAIGSAHLAVQEAPGDRKLQAPAGDLPRSDLADEGSRPPAKGTASPAPGLTRPGATSPGELVSQAASAPQAEPAPVSARSRPAQPAKPARPARPAQAAPGGGYRIPLRPGDLDLLARLVQAEAGGEPYAGKVAVAAVVINRVQSSRFPDSVRGVIFQKGAFEPVANGWIWNPPSRSAYQAALDALRGWDPSGGALFFFAPAKTGDAFVWSRPAVVRIGNHIFAR
ncbi:MAG: cell wall hydrolase [Bacillota bacterium]|nr:cell wall hydrolase [Bacillota bacterium]